MLHPTIRVLGLLVVAAALATLSLAQLLALALGLALTLALCGVSILRRALRGVLRMRWLLLAIAVLYGAFTPGTPILEALEVPTREGALEGLRRMLVLVDLLAAVQLLLALTPLPQLTAALHQILLPAAIAGLDRERFAARIGLVLEGVATAEEALRRVRRDAGASALDAAAGMIVQIEREALVERPAGPAQPALDRPPIWQWLLLPPLAWLLHVASR